MRYLLLGGVSRSRSSRKWVGERLGDLAGREVEEWADWITLDGKNPRADLAGIAITKFPEYRGVICLGRRVGGLVISGGSGFPYFRWTTPLGYGSTEVAIIPDPSGVERFWNDFDNVEKAQLFLSGLAERVTT